MSARELIGANEAATRLGVTKATLYAYVSRGKLSAVDGPGRSRLYAAQEVDRLHARSKARSGHGPVAGHALRWGEPVLESALCSIEPDGPHYRGRSALELADTGWTFERAAEFLITGSDAPVEPWEAPDLGVDSAHLRGLLGESRRPVGTLSLLVPALGLADAMRFMASESAELERGRALVARMAAAIGLSTGRAIPESALRERGIASILARALTGATSRRVVKLLDRALILVLDHELTASTFAARVAASSGADLYACIAAGLGAFSGPLHGGASDRAVQWVRGVQRPAEVRRSIVEQTRRGEAIPGFGHPLYPNGDPRVVPLLTAARSLAPRSHELGVVRALVAAMERLRRERPNVDLGLAALGFAVGVPDVAPSAVFAIGRSAGWIAHSLEQRRAGFLVRPRAGSVASR